MHEIPAEDPATYEMLCHADSMGVFQVESRAQMAMLPRLQPRSFYDLVVEVALVRPGPIQGDMVHPYLRRRQKKERIERISPAVDAVLERTCGVPIFQEQVMQLAVVAANFTPGEADQLRRAMAAWKRKGGLEPFEQKLLAGMAANGLPEAFARRIIAQIQGFGEYGFPESHAASFALLVYASAWLKRHHPAAFLCGLLNSQPMGFYSPSLLIQDARRHGVSVLAARCHGQRLGQPARRPVGCACALACARSAASRRRWRRAIAVNRENGRFWMLPIWRRAPACSAAISTCWPPPMRCAAWPAIAGRQRGRPACRGRGRATCSPGWRRRKRPPACRRRTPAKIWSPITAASA